MQDWLKAFHGTNQAFPAMEIAVKAAVALALGLPVGFEREWPNKDIGVRTFAMTALLGLLGALLGCLVAAQWCCGSDPDCLCQFSRFASFPQTGSKYLDSTGYYFSTRRTCRPGAPLHSRCLLDPCCDAAFSQTTAPCICWRAQPTGSTECIASCTFGLRYLAAPAKWVCRSLAIAPAARRLDHRCGDRLLGFSELCSVARLWLQRNLPRGDIGRPRQFYGHRS